MPALKLHNKTALIASAVTILVIATLIWLVSVRVAHLLRADQKELAELQASNLAEQIGSTTGAHDTEALTRLATLVRGSRPNLLTVRVWERAGGIFREQAAAQGSLPALEIPDDARIALRSGVDLHTVNTRSVEADDSLYRVFAPVIIDGRVSGAVEVVEQLDDAPAVAVRLERTALWLALVAVACITIAAFALFRRFVYRPLDAVLTAMQRAEAGDLEASAPVTADDELGALARGFNRMIARVREMTETQTAHGRVLEERVHAATVELATRNEDLEAANRELWSTTRRMSELERLAAAGQTAAQFAHEVGTPLNLISGHVQLLQAKFADDERAGVRLETISTQITRIERIVRNTLNRTRFETIELAPVDLSALLNRLFDATAPLLHECGVRLRNQVAGDQLIVEADADRLQQVFINLFNNALDAMPAGGELQVRTYIEESRVAVEVEDTGSGMTDEVRARIFDPLFTTKGGGGGTGLGLAIVKQIVREHKGEIAVESAPGQGSCFRLTFPGISTQLAKERAESHTSTNAQIRK